MVFLYQQLRITSIELQFTDRNTIGELVRKVCINVLLSGRYLIKINISFDVYIEMPSSGLSRWRQWWRNCHTKKILLLLIWNILIKSSRDVPLVYRARAISSQFYLASSLVTNALAPLIGWLADVKFGRYEIIKLGSLLSFLASIPSYFALSSGEGSTLTTALYLVAVTVQPIGEICFVAAMLSFLTDQLIGATSDELSAVVQWYVWAITFGTGFLKLSFSLAFLLMKTFS